MALWPFGRKKRKAQQQRAEEGVKTDKDDEDLGITTRITGPDGSKLTRKGREAKVSSKQSSRKVSRSRDVDSSNLPNPPPVPSLPTSATTSNQQPAISTVHDANTANTTALDTSATTRQPLAELNNNEQSATTSPAVLEGVDLSEYFAASQGPAPTLRQSRNTGKGDLARRKSTKRRAEDKARVEEIRSMTEPIPIPKRPRSYTGGLLSRDSKRFPQGIKPDLSRPSSEVSLPLAESLRSSLLGPSEMHNSFKVSAFDSLSPRPTIRYAGSPRQAGSAGFMSRASTRRDQGPPILEEDFGPKARIDRLADDMDAGRLRELMETDRRRKERRRKTDREKLEKKLQRKLEKQKASMTGDPGPSGMKDVEMKDADQPDPRVSEPSSKAVEASTVNNEVQLPQEDPSPRSWIENASKENLETEVPDDSTANTLQEAGTDDERETPVLEVAREVRLAPGPISQPSSPVLQQHSPRGPSGLSNVTTASARVSNDTYEPSETVPFSAGSTPLVTTLQAEGPRRGSETSARVGSSWKSLFRRGTNISRRTSSDKGRGTPSEFSNTSRESFARMNKPPPAPPVRSFKPKDGVPRRTRSKFREDLPELPISPPASRIQSPGSPQSPRSPASPYIDNVSKVDTMDEHARAQTPMGDVHPAFREEVTLSRGHSIRSDTGEGPSTAILSQSMASVDSEGSWLSGKPQKRSSVPISSFRESVASLPEQSQESEPSETYFARRETSGKAPARSGITSQLRPESYQVSPPGSPFEEPKVAKVTEGKAKLISRAPAFKSREGLLDEYNEPEQDPEQSQDISPLSSSGSGGSPTKSPTEEVAEKVSLHRATSVEYGKHHSRAISVGSARMLDLGLGGSDQKRSSVISVQRSSREPLEDTREETSTSKKPTQVPVKTTPDNGPSESKSREQNIAQTLSQLQQNQDTSNPTSRQDPRGETGTASASRTKKNEEQTPEDSGSIYEMPEFKDDGEETGPMTSATLFR